MEDNYLLAALFAATKRQLAKDEARRLSLKGLIPEACEFFVGEKRRLARDKALPKAHELTSAVQEMAVEMLKHKDRSAFKSEAKEAQVRGSTIERVLAVKLCDDYGKGLWDLVSDGPDRPAIKAQQLEKLDA